MRKEGSLKMVEYTLVPKKAAANFAMRAERKTVAELNAFYETRLAAIKERAAKTGQRDSGADGDYDERSLDSDEGDEPGRGRVASPASGSDEDEDEGEDVFSDDDAGAILRDIDQNTLDNAAASTSKDTRQFKKVPKKQAERIVTAEECRANLRLLFLEEPEICGLIYGPHALPTSTLNTTPKSDMFFVEVLAVPPARFRPASAMGDLTYENEQNALFSSILGTTYQIRDVTAALKRATSKDEKPLTDAPPPDPVRLYAQLLDATFRLQAAVNSLLDSTKNPNASRASKVPQGIKQLLEKKEGLFRMNMMVRTIGSYMESRSRCSRTGQARQLLRTLRHLARRQHRDQRDRRPARLRQEAHLSRARHPAQRRPPRQARHQRPQNPPGGRLHRV
jgi:DNA-directed RNA polymerase I subunit RPA1